jgi:oligoendopeptidase F
MTTTADKYSKTWPRTFVPADFDPSNWDEIQPLYDGLLGRAIDSADDLAAWLDDLGELGAAIGEHSSLCHIQMTCDTEDKEKEAAFLHMVTEISPKLKPIQFEIQKRIVNSPYAEELDPELYGQMLKKARNAIELYREENVPLEAEDRQWSQKYSKLNGAMSVEFQGETRTIQQMAKYQLDLDRAVRQEAWELVQSRRAQDRDTVNSIYDELIKLRNTRAINAGFENFRDYAHQSKNRFDYTVDDVIQFQDTIEELIVPLVREIQEKRKRALGVDVLRPWDLGVDPKGRPGLAPFENVEEMVEKCARIFDRINPELGEDFRQIDRWGNLDLDSRLGKAPGGYQATLSERRQPFIFMNAAGLQRDVTTLLHEGGHAFHMLAARELKPSANRHSPIEFAEVASMSMELLALPYLDEFHSEEDAARAAREQLERSIGLFPWVATIDGFQHWIYTHPDHTHEEREQAWLALKERFGGIEDWVGYEDHLAYEWQRQLHLFGGPFYYVEYAIAELGAMQVWRNSRDDEANAVAMYRSALAAGGSKPLPELFSLAGGNFDFSPAGVQPLVDLVREELNRLPE